MDEIKSILLVEDDPNDVELTLAALAEHNLANKVEVVRDGAEALDYLFRRGKFATRPDRFSHLPRQRGQRQPSARIVCGAP